MSWTSNYPPGRDRWELVATFARELGQTTQALVDELKRAGAKPERIAGVWMVRASELETFKVSSRLTQPQAPTPTGPSEQQPTSMPAVPEALANALARQEATLEELRREVENLLRQLAQERST